MVDRDPPVELDPRDAFLQEGERDSLHVLAATIMAEAQAYQAYANLAVYDKAYGCATAGEVTPLLTLASRARALAEANARALGLDLG